MNKMKFAACISLLAVCPWATADISYLNFGVGYIDGDYFNTDVDGFEFRGSFPLNSSVHFLASYDGLDFGTSGSDLDVLAFGAGWHMGVNQTVDFVATASILDVDIGQFSTDGIRLTGGIRGMASNELEFGAHLVFEDIDDVDDDIGYELEGRYFFDRNNSFGFTLRDVNSLDVFRIDVRFDF